MFLRSTLKEIDSRLFNQVKFKDCSRRYFLSVFNTFSAVENFILKSAKVCVSCIKRDKLIIPCRGDATICIN